MRKYLKYLLILLMLFALSAFVFPVNINLHYNGEEGHKYLSLLEKEVVEELNLARTQPGIYAGFLLEYSTLFVGRELRESGEITILTEEGKGAVFEAIRFLKNQKSLQMLKVSKGMSRGAKDMIKMQEPTNQTGHKGSDGSVFSERISRYGTWSGSCAENIDYGYNNARRIVMALIIDDGVRNRGHRKSIFDPGFTRVGVACGQHRKFKYMCVIELAVRYDEK
jgi:uncharacterized protein YkwD